ncbi:hypothetical protein PY32053_03927 (plasmid) [Paracoccus yeei]|uniref:Lipoprotein n=1 Tax=Paracoccus yeei TaxID=147645 RepID=A0A386USX7_9RHOB|nr:hypothetical protein [Paracoccus yeei]AYF03468.1 hypothetical protein PY32053_03927 [Paracoccus yeei]
MSPLANRLILIAGIALALSACDAIDQDIADMDRANYQRACDNLGIARETPSYDACMLQQQKMDNDNTQGIVARAEERQMLKDLEK